MPSVAEIQAQQQALRVAEAENALPHIEAVLDALNKPTIAALATIAQERAPEVADQQVQKAFNALANILTLTPSILGRLKEQMTAQLPPAEDAQV